ncbi:MAG: hypothetical protein ABIO43_06750 [Sphingomicrobium sp.]
MSKLTVLILIVVLLAGGLIFLSMNVREVPTKMIETEVSRGTNAQ